MIKTTLQLSRWMLALLVGTLGGCSSSPHYLEACFALNPDPTQATALERKIEDFTRSHSMAPARPGADSRTYLSAETGISIVHETRAADGVLVYLVSPARPCKRCTGLAGELMDMLTDTAVVSQCSGQTIETLQKRLHG